MSSYQAMIGEVPARARLETDWILGNFAKPREIAILKYIDFVREGIGLSSLWENLQIQIFLGTEKFVNKKQNLILWSRFPLCYSVRRSWYARPMLHI